MTLAVVILAAGQSIRMRSALPKVLHPLAGQPLLEYSLALAGAVSDRPPVLVVGQNQAAVRAAVGERAVLVTQPEPLGTGHAALQAQAALEGQCQTVMVIYGDMPLLRPETLRALAEAQAGQSSLLTLLAVNSEQLPDFGRVVRSPQGDIHAVVEAAQASPAQKRITEMNAGAYVFRADWLWQALPRLPLSPKGEYYLTDTVHLAVADGGRVASVLVEDQAEVIGINTRAQLAQAEAALRRRINAHWMEQGVTLVDPATTYIAPSVQLGRDTCLLPNTHLEGRTVVGEDCRLGPNTIVRDTAIGRGCRVECSVLEGAWLADEVEVGPFAHLRPGARLEQGVHMGNFGEVKNATLGPGVKMGHFSYVGDAAIGAEVNIGAGTITCNYDGARKHRTVIEPGAFIGSDTLLVAPVTVGQNARTGAGSVVTRDVPDESLAVGMPARVIRKLKPDA